MRRDSGFLLEQPAILLTTSTTDSDIIAHSPHESDVQPSELSDVFARVDSGFNAWQPDALRLPLISFLPPEILARVFHSLSLMEPPYCTKQNLGWIRATHVCRLWREVALGDSSLWARILKIPTNIEWISETLARARNAPLDIDINFGPTLNPELLLMFTSHISHTRKLRFYIVTTHCSDSTIQDIYCQEAPALEHFELISLTPPMSPTTFRELGGTTLFKGQAPKLRTLILYQVLIPWSLIPRGQLTRLEISLASGAPIDVPSHGDINMLIDLLVNSPQLEVLVLNSCLPLQLTHFPYGQTIHLQHLSRLSLGGLSFWITNLLKVFKIPSSTTLQLYCAPETTFSPNHPLLPVISAHFRSPVPIEFKMLSVTICRDGRFLEVTASTSLPTSKVRQSQNDELFVWFEGVPGHGDWTDFIKRVCRMLHISNLEFLSICAPGTVDVVNWVEVFKYCTKVTTMQAIGRGTSNLVRALATPNTASHALAPIFPKLAFMLLARLDFAEYNPPSGIVFDVVQRMVEYRALKILRIEDCIISAERAKALEKLVPKFHWDGEECFREVSEEDIYLSPPRWEEFFDDTT